MLDDSMDVPIEAQEQAQLLEQRFRDQAVARMYQNYVVLEGIKTPADVTTDGECVECGATIPAKRIQALMVEVRYDNGTSVWKASPAANLCVDCADLQVTKRRLYR